MPRHDQIPAFAVAQPAQFVEERHPDPIALACRTIDLLGRYVGWIGSTLKLPVALLLILVLLLVKPGGLFSRVAVRRV